MNRQDTVKMEISIGSERIFITVPFSRQDAVRETEKNVGKLYSSWHRQFPKKSNSELLAMMAYQYASFYDELLARVDDAKSLAADASAKLDAILNPDQTANESDNPLSDNPF